ncbi:hypothetical protein GX888_01915 [Candidatus Dojkabacteria bacterium]|uniref:Transglutaminase-like domain-containing protein n=1 Tax=Candidatus Dojkabacteria bacterium TaxID=2099670 RepID=A0A847VDI2_9BACT|nr:hypothetical protein [Candidatus Dojkabacteria bacterium]
MEILQDTEQNATETESSVEEKNIKPIYRGEWATQLNNGDLLPVGGSLFSDELTLKMELDFDKFDNELLTLAPESVKKKFERNRESIESSLEAIDSDLDPYLFFLCYAMQQTAFKLLEVQEEDTDYFSRQIDFSNKRTKKLSDTKGNAACAEIAALGQYLLQRAGLKSTYVGGITMRDPKDTSEYPEPHSFLLIDNPNNNGTLIFDISRPFSNKSPRILKTEVPLTYELLEGKQDLLVRGDDIFGGTSLWYGVGKPVAGGHKTISDERINN